MGKTHNYYRIYFWVCMFCYMYVRCPVSGGLIAIRLTGKKRELVFRVPLIE